MSKTKIRSAKAVLIACLSLCFALAMSMVVTQVPQAKAADTASEKAIHISVDTASDAFAEGISGLNATDSVAFAVLPFPAINNTLDALKNDALGAWWNNFGEIEVSYDFYSTVFMPGMDGIGFFIQDEPWILSNGDYVDDAGNNVTVQSTETASLYQNGWRHRTFSTEISSVAEHMAFVFCVQVQHLPTEGVIDMYYKNVTFKHNGAVYNVFGQVDASGNEISVFTVDGVNATAKGEAYAPNGGEGFLTRRIWNDQYDTLKTFTGVEALRANTLGASFEAVTAPDVLSISISVPDKIVKGTQYDLTSFASAAVTVSLVSATRNGEAVDLTDADTTAYAFEAGSWVLTYKAERNGQTAVCSTEFTVEEVPGFNATFVYGNGQANKTEKIAIGNKITAPEDPQRVGYTFNGWVNEDGEAFDFDADYESDKVIYASWKGVSNTSAIRIYIDTNNDSFTNGYSLAEHDDTKFIFGVSPLPTVNDSGAALKNDAINNWWNSWGETQISYDFWAPEYLPGMGGLSLTYDHDPWFAKQGDFKDAQGYLPTCYDEEFTASLGNGWYRRTFSFNMGETIPRDLYFLFAVSKNDLPTTGIIEFYITNITVRCHGVDFSLFGDESSVYNEQSVNALANGQPNNGYYRTTPVWMTAWETARDMTGSGENAVNNTLGASFEACDSPDISSVTASLPEIMYTDTAYDLNGYSNGEVCALANENGAVDISGANFSSYTFTTAGEWTVTYAVTKNGYTAKKSVSVVVTNANIPVIIQTDANAAVPSTAYAHENITLGFVYASVQSEKTLKAVPTVTNSNGDEYTVTETENGWSFTPTAKVNDVYTVVYTATNNYGTVTSAPVTVTVTDADKPVIDFSAIDGFTVGSFYEVARIKELISITDISDGTIDIATLSITDVFGNELIGQDTVKFMPEYSGTYTIRVVTVADADGNYTEGTVQVVGRQSEGLVLAIVADVSEENREEGKVKSFDTQIFHPENCTLNVGDSIVYDVMAYTVYSDGSFGFIPGLGAISGQVDSTWEMIYDLFGKTECLDAAGYSMARTADLSGVLKDENNLPVWYNRSYRITAGDAIYGKMLYHFAVGFETTAACGEQIIVMYRNVRLYDAEGNLKCVLWSGSQNINREWTNETGVSGKVLATFDVSPVAIEGKIPTTAVFGSEVSISKNLMKDPAIDEVIPSTVTVTAPNGSAVTLTETATGYLFKVESLGLYKVTVSAVNAKGYSTVKEYTISVADNERPVIEFIPDKDEYKEGDTVTVVVNITDGIFALDQFKEIGCTVTVDGVAVENAAVQTENGYTVTFVGEVGDYTILVYATDGANNETVETKLISVTEKTADTGTTGSGSQSGTTSGGCNGGIGAGSLMAAVVMLGGAALACVRKKQD